jgi:hypothetical protein
LAEGGIPGDGGHHQAEGGGGFPSGGSGRIAACSGSDGSQWREWGATHRPTPGEKRSLI